MIRKFRLALFAMSVVVSCLDAATPFHSRCLERIAAALHISFPNGMGKDMDNDSTWHYGGKPLRVRTNLLGDISHIGYKLFDSRFAAGYASRPLLDFLERYALEQDISFEGVDKAEEAVRKRMTFLEGDPSLIGERLPEMDCTIHETVRRSYTVEWGEGNRKVKVLVPADYQLFTGMNAIELEAAFERDVKRMVPIPADSLLSEVLRTGNRFRADSLVMVSNGNYLSDQIRSDLYLYEKAGGETLVLDAARPLQSVNNLLLTGYAAGEVQLELTIDKYGYQKSEIQISWQQLLAYFRMEKCQLYIGFKERCSGGIAATLFAVNPGMAYNHMVSIEFPLDILAGTGHLMKGKIYVYTPLQNITEKFFINNVK